MKLPTDIEREIQEIEADYARRGGQQAGSPRMRGLRAAIELELQARGQAGKVWAAMTPDERVNTFLSWRDVEKECPKCHGTGRLIYGTTATWHGGVGGSAMTSDVCDKCWGSGDALRQGADLRKLYSELDQLRRAAKNVRTPKQ